MNIDLPKALDPLLNNWPMLVGLLLLGVVAKALSSAGFKGWVGEVMVRRALAKLEAGEYAAFHDLYFPRPDGKGSTQVDHVVVSPFGIFVIETKNYRGWIFGGEKQRQWTQQIYRHKSRFQNPLHQNRLHIRALMAFLQLPESAFKSVVVIVGNAQLKTPMPANVLTGGLRRWIESHRETVLDDDQVHSVCAALADHERMTDRRSASRQHRRDVRQRVAG
jgi:hypothetical protein